jgi:SAM-dependent methyltransferase
VIQFDDPELVRREYATEAGLRARASVYEGVAGPDARDVALDAVRAAAPRRVLEVGCGWGEFAARVQEELGAEVVAVDLSPRMVELARERGVDARVGDVQELPFADGEFDVAVANWMLYHVPDLDRALAELARVVRVGGQLVAATNGLDHLGELWAFRHFPSVERHDVAGAVTLDREAARGYIASSVMHKHLADRVPELDAPLVAIRRNTIFVATK